MIFYDFSAAPSPRRARMFIAEKGLDIETRQINMMERDHFSADFLAINPRATVPVLITDEGLALTENNGIAAYLEARFPEPALLGQSAEEKGSIAMWNTICELHGFMPVGETLRNSNPRYDGRAVTGQTSFERIPELADRAKERVDIFFNMLEEQLSGSAYLASDAFSMADITGFVVCEFAKMIKLEIPENCTATAAWIEKISARPSASI